MDWYNAGHMKDAYRPLCITKVPRHYSPKGDTRLRKRHRVAWVQYEYGVRGVAVVFGARLTPRFTSPEEADNYMRAMAALEKE